MKKRWLGLMTFFIVAAVVVASVVIVNTKADAATSLTISTQKTEFVYGEAIPVTITGLTEDLRAHDLEFRLEQRILEDSEGFAQRVGYHQYFDIGKDAKDENGVALTPDQISDTRVMTFKNGTQKHPDNGGEAEIPVGSYTLWVLDFTDGVVVGNRINIQVYACTISTGGKTVFNEGETIDVTYAGLADKFASEANDDFELRLDPGHGLTETPAYTDYIDLTNNGGTYRGETATVKFPDDGIKDLTTVSTGKYTLWVWDYSPNRVAVSNKIEIEIKDATPPTITMDKTQFTVGEDIVVKFKNMTEDEWHRGSSYFEIDIFKKGEYPGSGLPSVAGYVIWNSDATKPQTGKTEGTITFPADDNDRNGKNFPLAVGEYEVYIRYDNSWIGDPLSFKVGLVPEISVSKTTLQEGDELVINYKNISTDAGKDLEIRLYSADANKVGKDQSKMYYDLIDTDGTLLVESSGSISFPKDDARKNTQAGALMTELTAGTYELKLIGAGNKQFGDTITITVSGSTGDAEMFAVAALIVVCAGACVVMMKRKKCSE